MTIVDRLKVVRTPGLSFEAVRANERSEGERKEPSLENSRLVASKKL